MSEPSSERMETEFFLTAFFSEEGADISVSRCFLDLFLLVNGSIRPERAVPRPAAEQSSANEYVT